MAAARIAAVFFAAILAFSGAQLSSQTQVTVLVTDTTGGVIVGARVEIDPAPGQTRNPAIADRTGQAVIDLPAGTHHLRVSHTGFRSLDISIDAQQSAGQVLSVALFVDESTWGYEGPCCPPDDLPAGSGIESVVRNDLIPLQPVGNLAPLPSHSAKRRW